MSDAKQAEYDCFVLSGGGAKGAYGAGAAKAIQSYRELKGLNNPVCYIGASAGALNAYMLSAYGADELIKLWLTISNKDILGVRQQGGRWQTLLRVIDSTMRREAVPRSVYNDKALRQLVGKYAKFDAIKSPLIIAATDYTRGQLRAFYVSPLIDEFVKRDWNEIPRRRRFDHLRRLNTNEELVDALCASTSIPMFFPPVRVQTIGPDGPEDGWFIDGGVGNNTPTREAAYFFRFLESTGAGTARAAYCVKQDRPRIITDRNERLDFSGILKRTLDVYHYVHTDPIVSAWNRINREVADQARKVSEMIEWLNTCQLDPILRTEIGQRIEGEFRKTGGRIPRLDVPLLVIEPSIDLGDTLEFDPARARNEIAHGYSDALNLLQHHIDPRYPERGPAIDEVECKRLLNRSICS